MISEDKLYPMRIYQNLLGEKAADKYVVIFKTIGNRGLWFPSWNWASFFFGGFWMLYRKQGALWISYSLFISFCANVLVAMYGAWAFYLFYMVFAKCIVPMYANAYLLRRINAYIKKANKVGGNPLGREHKNKFAAITEPSLDNPPVF